MFKARFNNFRFIFVLSAFSLLVLNRPLLAEERSASREIEVTALKIAPGDLPIIRRYVGKTCSVSRVEIRARVDGFLEERLYTEGARVEKGQLLFKMDQKPFVTKLDFYKAALSAQEAALLYSKVSLERAKSMVTDNVTARKDLDYATANFNSAQAAVEEAKANVEQQNLELSYTTITSPINGLSSFARQEVGAYINSTSNSLLTYVEQTDPIRVEFSVSENDVLKAQKEQRAGLLLDPKGNIDVEIVLADGTHYPHHGKITFADVSLSGTTGTFLVRAQLPNPKDELIPGQFVRINVSGGVRPNAIAVPQRAVQENSRGDFVWVVGTDMKVKAQPVVTGDWYEKSYWFIDNGLKSGEIVVVDGVSRLREGSTVRITEYLKINPAEEDKGDSAAKPSEKTDK